MAHELRLRCPECHCATALTCQASGTRNQFTVTLISQTCECDPFGAWEDVWEQARELVFEERALD
jgi:hypothetical protein